MRQSRSVLAGWLLGLGALLVAAVLWGATVGAAPITPTAVARIVLDRLGLLSYTPTGPHYTYIVLQLRLPRIALAAAVGAALAVAGTVMQGFFRNPLADPSIIGVSTGAAAGAVAVLVLPALIPFGLPVAALVGGLVTAFAVYLIATRDGHTPVATLLLAGVAIQTFLGAAISFMMVQSKPHSLRAAVVWLIGSLGDSAWSEAATVTGATVVGLLVLGSYGRDLNVLLLGEADAHAVGVEVERTKRILLAVSSLLTGFAVMYVGVIGFVGLVVPHVMRLLVGPDHRVLLPTSALAGASFLVISDTIARAGAQEFPVGIVTAAVGAPFFLYLLRRREVYAL
ncbi:MAG: iron chelate uptake ABC transporter family permease subunit [Halobacteriaceae archaeon]